MRQLSSCYIVTHYEGIVNVNTMNPYQFTLVYDSSGQYQSQLQILHNKPKQT